MANDDKTSTICFTRPPVQPIALLRIITTTIPLVWAAHYPPSQHNHPLSPHQIPSASTTTFTISVHY
ncbi:MULTISPECIES: hypothetical protein [Snodgrassella]|uniref:hypothetical protein n=1 Tax=Snodgrassella TaxID=1193515 RepID=UPI0011847BDD|nr:MULTISPECIES: hypothetical protein [Snodgrassella]